MTELILRESVKKTVDRTILITGSARSGTTIMGKLIHSMKQVEYMFEPPFLVSLFSKIETLDENNWKFFFSSYLYEDFFLNSIAGRNLNFNLNDDSSILNAKSELEIENRLKSKYRKESLEILANDFRPAIKIPSLVPYIGRFSSYFPKIKIIYLRRNPVDSVNSLIEKDWFSDNSLNNSNREWPVFEYKKWKIPYWVQKEDFEHWIKLNDYDRCAYYFIKMNEDIELNNVIKVDYDELLQYPHKIVDKLSNELELKPGIKTHELIQNVKKTEKDRDLGIIDRMSPFFKEILLKYK